LDTNIFNMNSNLVLAVVVVMLVSCKTKSSEPNTSLPIEGTWQLISGTIIEKGDTTVTDYTQKQSMIKVINKSHFAFLSHDLHHGKDSAAMFGAGGGRYTLTGDQYTEYLAYCHAREWEGHTFQFKVKIQNDTLIQQGVEKIEEAGVDRLNIEQYVRVRP